MTMQTATPTRDRAAYQRAYYESRHPQQETVPPPVAAPAPVAPLRVPLLRLTKPTPERRAVARPPWHQGDPRPVNGCTRYGDDDWPISPAQDAAMGIRFGRSTPALVK